MKVEPMDTNESQRKSPVHGQRAGEADPQTQVAQLFEQHRAHLLGLAYRMLGSVMEAEDVVQEAYLRYRAAAARETIETPKAYLTTITTRLALDVLKSARVQREAYVGPWLPEPMVTAAAPAELLVKRESLSNAFLLLLERLSPLERAVYLLREIFDYGYQEIATIVEKSEVNCRQIFSRARKGLAKHGVRPALAAPARDRKQQQLLRAFLQAVELRDTSTLTRLLAEEIRFESDGGGKVKAALRPIQGREQVIRFLLGIERLRPAALELTLTEINESSAVVMWVDGTPIAVWTVAIGQGQIEHVWAVLNPEKLHYVIRQ